MQTFCLTYFPGGSDGKASVYNAGDPGSIPGLGSSPGEGNGNPLQYSCLPPTKKKGGLKEIFKKPKKNKDMHFTKIIKS